MQEINEKGQFITGHTPWNKGKKHSKETRNKISKARKGCEPWNRGKKHSEETKKKISETNRGKAPWMKEKRHTERAKRKLSRAKKLNPTRYWLGKRRGPFSEEWRRNMGRKGEKNANWKGGITDENGRIRGSIDYKLWQEAVFERDNWTCQSCGKCGGNLHAHHILPFSEFPHLRFAVNNGQTLCVKCHRKVHKK